MALSGRLQYFPATHLIGIIVAIVVLIAVLFWPSSQGPSVQETRYVIEMTESDAPEPDIPALRWESDEIRSGDSLSVFFSRHNLSAADVFDMVAIAPKEALQLRPGQKIQWIRSQDNRVQQFQIEVSPLTRHAFLRDENDTLQYDLLQRDAEYLPRYASAVIENSLFYDGSQAGIPDQVLVELAGIFGWDIDFALDIRQGDRFSLIYDEVFVDGELIGNGNIKVARFHNQGRELTAIRYTDSQGNASYYTPDGNSMRKEFLRNPIDFARISSRFNPNRRHPVLNTIRAHKGTDYAAPTGTPIKATGDGRIIHAGKKGGYGNTVIIQHGSTYQTIYAHLSRFNRNTRVGRSVKQGQVIGYVGSTGLATGPHLHYEFLVNGVHRDSLRIQLPKAQSVPATQKDDFRQHAQGMLSWLNSFGDNRQIGARQ